VEGEVTEEAMHVGEIAKTSIEIGLAVVNNSSELTQEQATVALRKLETQLAVNGLANDRKVLSESSSSGGKRRGQSGKKGRKTHVEDGPVFVGESVVTGPMTPEAMME